MEEGVALPGEAEDKCCWFLPIKIGMYLIGALMIGDAISNVLKCIELLSVNFIFAVLYGAAAAPIVLGCVYFIRFFMSMDDSERRNGLFKACMLTILSNICTLAIAIVMFFTVTGTTFANVMVVLIVSGVSSVLFAYYAGVSKRFASQA